MKLFAALLFALIASSPLVVAQVAKLDIPYGDSSIERQVLDIYAPTDAKKLPVVFWIHGGGWVTGDKASVQIKPQWFLGFTRILNRMVATRIASMSWGIRQVLNLPL